MTHGAFSVVILVAVACGSSLPLPPAPAASASARADEKVEVPFPPPPARVEFIPEQPRSGAVWVDGEWSWTGTRWAWNYGKWVVPPPGSTFAPWRTVRASDGALLFVPGVWQNEHGAEIADPEPLAMGRARQENIASPEGEPVHTAPNRAPAATPSATP